MTLKSSKSFKTKHTFPQIQVGCYTVLLGKQSDVSEDQSAVKMSVFKQEQHQILQDFNLK
jgi:hypothetical protein